MMLLRAGAFEVVGFLVVDVVVVGEPGIDVVVVETGAEVDD